MYLDSRFLFLYVETPLHAGAGAGLGAIDLPIQRERVTGYPLVQASGVKGALRSEAPAGKQHTVVFGSDPEATELSAGAAAFGDARILLFPVRSLTGIFAWTTSMDVLRRWQRDAKAAGMTDLPDLPESAPKGDADGEETHCYVSGRGVATDNTVVLEEFAFTVDGSQEQVVRKLAGWLAEKVFPEADEYKWWGKQLQEKLVVLPDDEFRDFTRHATEVLTRIRLDETTKTVVPGALWTEEHLPVDTVLYAPVRASRFRGENGALPDAWQGVKDGTEQARTVLQWLEEKLPARLQLGGDETVGRGVVSLRWTGGAS